MSKIIPVILCGGSGERLWPLSRKDHPKQFLKLVGNSSPFQQSTTRITADVSKSIIVTNYDYRFIVRQQLQEVGINDADIIIEPERKNTAPAILVAAHHIAKKNPDHLMVVMPSDHYIPDQDAFTKVIQNASDNIKHDQIICLGIQPSRPDTGYGYIKVRNTEKIISEVTEFVEKPNLEMAHKYLSSGDYLWNSGIFIVRASDLLKLAEKLQPEMMWNIKAAYNKSNNDTGFIKLCSVFWKRIEEDSFDYAFMEKDINIGYVSFKGIWSDLGDWKAVGNEKDTDSFGNNLIGNAHQIDSKQSLLWSDSNDKILIGIGLENIIAVATSDAVLVANKSKSQDIKSIIKTLKKSNKL